MDAAAGDRMDSQYERDKMMGTRHPRRSGWLLAAAGVAIAVLFVWAIPRDRNDREEWQGGGVEVGSASQGSTHSDLGRPQGRKDPATVGTTGAHDEAVGDNATVLREIETITGATNPRSLVGRRVDLHVDVQEHANDHAFWVGSPDNRVLVVWGRDNRDGLERQAGLPDSSDPLRKAQRAAISGVIQPIPRSEHRYSWDLTEDDQRELDDRKIYIRADSVKPETH
jgi:hypothetical protein